MRSSFEPLRYGLLFLYFSGCAAGEGCRGPEHLGESASPAVITGGGEHITLTDLSAERLTFSPCEVMTIAAGPKIDLASLSSYTNGADYGVTRTVAVDAHLTLSRGNTVLHSDRRILPISKAEIAQGLQSARPGMIEFSWRARVDWR